MRENVFTSFTTRLMVSFLFMLSLYLLLHGHNYPGGGFIGGLVGASGVVSLYISRAAANGAGSRNTSRVRLNSNFWGYLMFLGITIVLLSGMGGLLFGDAYLDSWWYSSPIPGIGKLGTPFFFDVGVYLTVIAVVISITRVLANVKNPDDIYKETSG